MAETALGRWLNIKFLEWQLHEGQRKNLTQFAEYLGMSQAYLSMCINGERESISQEMADRIAARFGDEIYEITGKQRPDPLYSYVTRNWDKLSSDQQHEIKEKVAEYLTGPQDTGS